MKPVVIVGTCQDDLLLKGINNLVSARNKLITTFQEIVFCKYKIVNKEVVFEEVVNKEVIIKYIDPDLSFEEIKNAILKEFQNLDIGFYIIENKNFFKNGLLSFMKNKFNYNYFNLVYDIILEKEVVKPLYSFFQEILIRHYFLLFSYFYFENVALCILNKVHERPFFEEEFTRSDVLNTALNAVFWKNVEDASRDFKVHRFVDFLEKAQKQFNKKEDFNASDFLHTLLKELMKDVHKAFIDTLNYLSCNAKFNVDKKNLNLKNFARVYEFNLKR